MRYPFREFVDVEAALDWVADGLRRRAGEGGDGEVWFGNTEEFDPFSLLDDFRDAHED